MAPRWREEEWFATPMIGSRVFHSPWRARARSFDSTLSFIICVLCVYYVYIYNESVVPQFSLRDKRNDYEIRESKREIEKIFWDDLSAVCALCCLFSVFFRFFFFDSFFLFFLLSSSFSPVVP